ncbi:YajG family lipoprotein [Thalassotalea fusca]
MRIKHLVAVSLLVLVQACSSAPNQVVISPELPIVQSNGYAQQSVATSVIDLRTAHHLIQIEKPEQAAKLISTQQHLPNILERALNSSFERGGMTINAASAKSIEVVINKALFVVKQETLKYQANANIVLTAKVENGAQTLTKTFTVRGNNEGPLTADIAVLERDFNQLLTKIIGNIVNDQEVQQFVNN